jgi:hypothetical protein
VTRYHGDDEGPDPEPGFYYASAADGSRLALLAGPFRWHVEALAWVDRARALGVELDRKAWFYGFGTVRMPDGRRLGILNDRLGISGELLAMDAGGASQSADGGGIGPAIAGDGGG